jgi:hypothetical protein
MMMDELEKIWKEAVVAPNEVLLHLCGGTEGGGDKPQSRQELSQLRFEPRNTSLFHVKIILSKCSAGRKFKSEVEV